MGKVELTFGEKIVDKIGLYREDTKLFKIEDINLDKIELSKKNKMTKRWSKKIIIYIYIYMFAIDKVIISY